MVEDDGQWHYPVLGCLVRRRATVGPAMEAALEAAVRLGIAATRVLDNPVCGSYLVEERRSDQPGDQQIVKRRSYSRLSSGAQRKRAGLIT